MRRVAKTVAERILLHAGPAALSRRLHRGRDLVLAYHNIVPDGETILGEASLHLPRQQFAGQLDLLLRAAVQVVSLDELMEDTRHSERTHPLSRVAITFDDAYRGATHAGVEELIRRGLPATFFVVPGLVGDHTFWWDALSATGSDLGGGIRDAALNDARGRNDEVLAWARRTGIAIGTVPEYARSASEAEIRAAVAQKGIELASHTWSHPNLALLSEGECRDEFAQADAWLVTRFGLPPRWLSYPYGLYGETAERASADNGYHGAFRIDGGWLTGRDERQNLFRLPRLNVPAGISLDGFALRLAGLLSG